MSWYLTIRSDASYSRHVTGGMVVELLAGISDLRQTGPADFEAAPGMPWVCVIVAKTDKRGNYATDGILPDIVHVVELVCSDFEASAWYDAIAARIAQGLGWEARELHENRWVWPLGKSPSFDSRSQS